MKKIKSFETFVNERLNIATNNLPSVEVLVGYLLALRTQFHVYHLLTLSYAEHMAIGEFYDSLTGHIDGIAETLIALGGSIKIEPYNYVSMYNKHEMMNQLTMFRSSVVSPALDETNRVSFMSINDKIIAVQQSVDTLLYKLDLS